MIQEELKNFFYVATLNELKLMNHSILDQDISYNTLLYLDLISYNMQTTASGLASTLGISKPAVTAKINELIKMGLVIKKQSQTDKRVYYLEVAGQLADEYKIYDIYLQKASQIANCEFTKEELETFNKVLAKITTVYSGGN